MPKAHKFILVAFLFTLFFSILVQRKAAAHVPQGTETCSSCQAQGKSYLCFDTVAIAYVCETAPLDIPNVRCNVCGETIAAPTPTQTQFCTQVLTPARNLRIRECQTFSTSCLPDGWVSDPTCGSGTGTLTPTPGESRTNPTPTQNAPTPTPDCLFLGWGCRTTPAPTQTQSSCSLKSAGDANCDGGIDLLDFNIWRDEFLGNVTTKNADFNADGNVDLLDFNIWRNSFVNRR